MSMVKFSIQKACFILAGGAIVAAFSGCIVAPVAPRHQPVYVAPAYPTPGVGWVWEYHPNFGWGWHHPEYGWHKGWH